MRVFFLAIFMISVSAVAKSQPDGNIDMKEFSKELNQNISQRVKHNPQQYETREIMKKPSRSPASIGPVEMDRSEEKDLDKFDEQASGHNKL